MAQTRKESKMSIGTIWLGSLVTAMAKISDPLKVAVRGTIKEIARVAKQTPNLYDDLVVDLLANLFGVDTEDPQDKPKVDGK